jgi:hypothetical protein
LATYDVHLSDISRELAQLKNENDLLHGGIVTPLDQDCELAVAYRCLSEAEHRWIYT